MGQAAPPRILIVIDAYRPGYLAGGPIRSISNIVDTLGADFDFRVLTRNRDHGTSESYDGIKGDAWIRRKNEQVYYSSAHRISARLIDQCATSENADLVYLNSLFSSSSRSYLAWRRLHHSGPAILLAPRGQFDAGALHIHRRRKRAYLTAARSLGLLNRISWQATNENERESVLRIAGREATVVLAPNVSRKPETTAPSPPPKASGSIRLVFLSRISPKKNLPFLLDVLASVSGDVHLTVAGPRDPGYLDDLSELASALPANVIVDVVGSLDHQSADEAIANHHALVLPTLGENHGHSIWESIRLGRPVLISDQTPWEPNDKARYGWAIPLSDRQAWIRRLDQLVELDQQRYTALTSATFRFAHDWQQQSRAIRAHDAMFRVAIGATLRGTQ